MITKQTPVAEVVLVAMQRIGKGDEHMYMANLIQKFEENWYDTAASLKSLLCAVLCFAPTNPHTNPHTPTHGARLVPRIGSRPGPEPTQKCTPEVYLTYLTIYFFAVFGHKTI